MTRARARLQVMPSIAVASACITSVMASMVFQLSPEEAAVQRLEWIANTVDRSDLVTVVLVTQVEPRFQFGPTLGDWSFVITGSRLGLPTHGPELIAHLATRQLLKGQIGRGFAVAYEAQDPASSTKFSDVPYEPRRIIEGHEYIVFCRRNADTFELIDFKDAADDPKLADDTLAYVRRRGTSQPRRRTTRSTRRTPASRGLQRKPRAAGRAGYRRRCGHRKRQVNLNASYFNLLRHRDPDVLP